MALHEIILNPKGNGGGGDFTIVSKSNAYSLTNTDIDKQFQVTGTTTITLPDSLTWATNKGCEVVNIGAGTVTIALGGSVSVNGGTTSITLDPYKGVVLQLLSTNTYLGIGI